MLGGRSFRALAYWSKCYVGQISRGDDYHLLAPVISVLVADFVSFPSDPGYHHVFELREHQKGFSLFDHMRLQVLSLPRLPPLEDAGAADGVVNRGRLFKSGSDPVVLEELAMRSPELDKARRAMDRYFYEIELDEVREEGCEEGCEEGLAAGEARGRIEAVLAVCVMRGLELTSAQRDRILTCRDLARLDRWLRSASTAEAPGDVFV